MQARTLIWHRWHLQIVGETLLLIDQYWMRWYFSANCNVLSLHSHLSLFVQHLAYNSEWERERERHNAQLINSCRQIQLFLESSKYIICSLVFSNLYLFSFGFHSNNDRKKAEKFFPSEIFFLFFFLNTEQTRILFFTNTIYSIQYGSLFNMFINITVSWGF